MGRRNKLLTFLLGTVDPHSALRVLRGKGDILRIIWIYACSEWWQLHLQSYTIPLDLNPPEFIPYSIPDLRNYDLYERKKYLDCPLALLDDSVSFPSVGSMPEGSGGTGPINVNMMSFDLFDPEGTLPSYVHGYLDMIKQCRSYVKSYVDMLYLTGIKGNGEHRRESSRKRLDYTNIRNRIAYLTIDERPLSQVGASHRRGGVHVECPGALRSKEIANKSIYTPDLSFYHPWGMGQAIDEFLVGGIFLASNVSDSTAVWNCRVHDTFGDIIGPHGSLERMREVLGPPTKRLGGGELVWLSDRTPHESLPIEDGSIRRQFFRLVVGEIAFWFADHNTRNPTGFEVPPYVPIIEGNKFELVKGKVPVVWECGNKKQIRLARATAEFRKFLYKNGIGFLADDLLKMGVYNKEILTQKFQEVETFIESLDPHYFSHHTKLYIILKALSR
eukprot:gene3858-4121_t